MKRFVIGLAILTVVGAVAFAVAAKMRVPQSEDTRFIAFAERPEIPT